MLTPEELEHIPDELVDLYSEIENELIRDIIRRIYETGEISSTTELRIKASQQLGVSYNDLLKIVSKYSGKSRNKIREAFENAGIKSINYDNKIYKMANLKSLPLRQSPNLLQVLEATLEKTNEQFHNFTLSMVDSSQKIFLNQLDKIYLKTITGAFSYNEAVKQGIEELAKNGLYIEYPSGRKDHIDVAVKRAVRTGVSQTVGELQEIRAKEMGCEYYEVSAHVGARNIGEGYCNHEKWQGKVYKIKGSTREFPNFQKSTGYRKIQGLCGINCRHSFFPFFPGISKRAYTDEELKDIANQTVTYNGQKIKKYQAEQMQRRMERDIRKTRRSISSYTQAYRSSKSDREKEKYKDILNTENFNLKRQNEELIDFIEQTKWSGSKKEVKEKKIQYINGKLSRYKELINQNINIKNNSKNKIKYDVYTQYKNLVQEEKNVIEKDVKEYLNFVDYGGSDKINTLEKYIDIKYNNSKLYKIIKGFQIEVDKNNIDVLTSFDNFLSLHLELENRLIGLKTTNGIEIKSVSTHFTGRIIGNPSHILKKSNTNVIRYNEKPIRPGVSIEDAENLIINGTSIEEQDDDRVVISNDKTRLTLDKNDGRLIQINPYRR